MSFSNRQTHRLALAHDFLIQMGGAEKVVEVMARHYPHSPIYTSATAGKTCSRSSGTRHA